MKRTKNEPVYNIGLTSHELGTILDALDRYVLMDKKIEFHDKLILIKEMLYDEFKLTQNL